VADHRGRVRHRARRLDAFVFLFVLFGAMLEKAGAGNYFIKVAFALLGHLRGGPAKASVVASARPA
jgi:TRAP-type uncharacterized transport system fused permease subunit